MIEGLVHNRLRPAFRQIRKVGANLPRGKRAPLLPRVRRSQIVARRLRLGRHKYNSELAGKYGVDKLVWCEEGSSARSSAGMVRGWFHYDVDNDKKQKPLPNASAAIECMQKFTNTDFYNDLYCTQELMSFNSKKSTQKSRKVKLRRLRLLCPARAISSSLTHSSLKC